MEKPMFYQGQRVVFVGVPPQFDEKDSAPLIEGKSYYVENPNVTVPHPEWGVYIMVGGVSDGAFHQGGFIPYDTDAQLEEEIHQAMKGNLIEN